MVTTVAQHVGLSHLSAEIHLCSSFSPTKIVPRQSPETRGAIEVGCDYFGKKYFLNVTRGLLNPKSPGKKIFVLYFEVYTYDYLNIGHGFGYRVALAVYLLQGFVLG